MCDKCGSVFNALKPVRESRGECFGFPAHEDMGVCPCCDSVEFHEVVACAICGEWLREEELTELVCSDCGNNIVSHATEDIKQAAQRYSKQECRYLLRAWEDNRNHFVEQVTEGIT